MYIMVYRCGSEPVEVVGYELYGELEKLELGVNNRIVQDPTFDVLYVGKTEVIKYKKECSYVFG